MRHAWVAFHYRLLSNLRQRMASVRHLAHTRHLFAIPAGCGLLLVSGFPTQGSSRLAPEPPGVPRSVTAASEVPTQGHASKRAGSGALQPRGRPLAQASSGANEDVQRGLGTGCAPPGGPLGPGVYWLHCAPRVSAACMQGAATLAGNLPREHLLELKAQFVKLAFVEPCPLGRVVLPSPGPSV